MEQEQTTVDLNGKQYTITLPPFAEREDIAVVYSSEAKHPRRQQRALAGALGLCVPALGLGGVNLYEELDLDLVKYGGRVYSAAMAKGLGRDEIIEASVKCFTACCESLFPRESAVEDKANFIEAPEGQPTD
tara:strand:+ start:3463 stop:3858 length:396 start_codon:yes stop_codon:yes gene_type:complete